MYLHRYCHVGLLGVALFLTGCDQSVTFSPEAGDEKRYWIYTASQDTEEGDIQYHLNSLLHYKMDSIDDIIQLQVIPEHLDLSLGNGERTLNSATSNARNLQVFQAGFDLEVDKKSGTLLSLTGQDTEAWSRHVEYFGENHPLLNMLRHQVSVPGLNTSISTKVGDNISLPQFLGLPATLTVTQITAETLHATVEGKTNNRQLYGQLTLARENGWIESVYAVISKDQNASDFIAIQSAGNPQHISDPVPYFFHPQELWQTLSPILSPDPSGTPPAPHVMIKDDVFAYESGMLASGIPPYLSATLVHNLGQAPYSGHITLTDFRVRNEAGDDLGLPFVAPTNYHYFNDNKNSENAVLLMGWDHRETLKKMHSATATAHYYPDTLTPYTVQWREGEPQTFTLGDMTLDVTPYPQRKGEYHLSYNHGSSKTLLDTIDGLKGDIGITTLSAGPDWLTDSARDWLAWAGDPAQAIASTDLKLTEESDSVTFYVKARETNPLYSQTVTFLPKHLYEASATLPPITGNGPYNQPELSEAEKGETEAHREMLTERYAVTPFSDITIDRSHPSAAMISLPMGWSSVCKAEVINDVEINHNGLIWQGHSKGPFPTDAFQLMTEDGIKQHFYDLTVETRLTCEGSPQWQTIPNVTNQAYPWLMNLSQLASITEDQPISALFKAYRFSGHDGELLWALDRKGESIQHFDHPLSTILYDGKYLKFSGNIIEVSQLQATGEPQEKTWVTTFPPLPKG